MKIHLTRDSVCAGDDADAPHARTMQFSDGKSLETVIEEIARSGYLASIAGGKATWSVVADRPIAVVAQQWQQPKFLPELLAPLSVPQSADGLARLHFRYHLQEDPNTVYSSLAGDHDSESWEQYRMHNSCSADAADEDPSKVSMNPIRIKAVGIPYRQGWLEVATIHPGHINIETWGIHPDVDMAPAKLHLMDLEDENVTGNTELEFGISEARQIAAALLEAADEIEEAVANADSPAPKRHEGVFYRLYCSSGNDQGIPEHIGYSEIGSDGYWLRYVEISADGTALRYDRSHSADTFGVLPEGQWDEAQAAKREYGALVPLSAEQFEAVWRTTRCVNVE